MAIKGDGMGVVRGVRKKLSRVQAHPSVLGGVNEIDSIVFRPHIILFPVFLLLSLKAGVWAYPPRLSQSMSAHA